jgi:glycosyltransferase involved in cell wall biosynthesis
MKRYIALQIGARRNYMIPQILAEADLLEAFYTDVCADLGLGKFLNLLPHQLQSRSVRNILSRRLPSNCVSKTGSFSKVNIRQFWEKQLKIEPFQTFKNLDSTFSNASIKKGIGSATHVFSMFGEGTAFLEFAKSQGLTIVVEVFITLDALRIFIDEETKFYGYQKTFVPDWVLSGERFQRVANVTDFFIVPSQTVMDSLNRFDISSDRCFLVPYFVQDQWLKVKNSPQKGRILFVGTADCRKGIHILADAAVQLKDRGYEFRVAGGVSDAIKDDPLFKELTFLGRIPRDKIFQEYEKADIFVLPSLAEGSAEVIYEALGVGLPIVTTFESGSVVQDGIEGLIISSRNTDQLVDAIVTIVEDREKRDIVSNNARNKAKAFSVQSYRQRLLSVFTKI